MESGQNGKYKSCHESGGHTSSTEESDSTTSYLISCTPLPGCLKLKLKKLLHCRRGQPQRLLTEEILFVVSPLSMIKARLYETMHLHIDFALLSTGLSSLTFENVLS
jgi:hypothetical protein